MTEKTIFVEECFDELMTALTAEIKSMENAEIEADLDPREYEAKIRLIKQAQKFYKLGVNKQIPEEWQKAYMGLYKDYLKKKDPDYETYLTLKRKFD